MTHPCVYIYIVYIILWYIYICIYIYIHRINIHISCAKTWLSLAPLIWGWLLPSPWRTSLRGKAFAGGKGMEMGWCELIGWVRFALWKQGSYNWYDLWLHHHHTCIYIYIEYVQKHMIKTSMIIFIAIDVIAFIMVFVSYACAFWLRDIVCTIKWFT